MRPKKKIKVALKTNKPQEAKQFNIESLSIAKTHAQIACLPSNNARRFRRMFIIPRNRKQEKMLCFLSTQRDCDRLW